MFVGMPALQTRREQEIRRMGLAVGSRSALCFRVSFKEPGPTAVAAVPPCSSTVTGLSPARYSECVCDVFTTCLGNCMCR